MRVCSIGSCLGNSAGFLDFSTRLLPFSAPPQRLPAFFLSRHRHHPPHHSSKTDGKLCAILQNRRIEKGIWRASHLIKSDISSTLSSDIHFTVDLEKPSLHQQLKSSSTCCLSEGLIKGPQIRVQSTKSRETVRRTLLSPRNSPKNAYHWPNGLHRYRKIHRRKDPVSASPLPAPHRRRCSSPRRRAPGHKSLRRHLETFQFHDPRSITAAPRIIPPIGIRIQ